MNGKDRRQEGDTRAGLGAGKRLHGPRVARPGILRHASYDGASVENVAPPWGWAASFLLGAGLAILIVAWPSGLGPALNAQYGWALICYTTVAIGMLGVIFWIRLDPLDPMLVFSLLYLGIFGVQPAVDIQTGTTLFYGEDLSEYAEPAQMIATLGYIFAWFGWASGMGWRPDPGQSRLRADSTDSHFQEGVPAARRNALLLWAVAFGASILNSMMMGRSPIYIITLGGAGVANQTLAETQSGFVGFMGIATIPCAVLYARSHGHRVINLFMQMATFLSLAISGFRYIIVIFVVAHIVAWSIQRQKSPRVVMVAVTGFLVALFSGAMEFYRTGMRQGLQVDWSGFGWGTVMDAVTGNLAIYKSFYAVVSSVPDLIPFGLGRQMVFQSATMFIPRAIWPDKPIAVVNDPIKAVSPYAGTAGAAYPNIGEFYFEFGLIGVILAMLVFGFLMARSRRAWRYSGSIYEIVLYACWTGSVFQLTIRGYTPTNIYLVLMLLGPTLLLRKFSRLRNRGARRANGHAHRAVDGEPAWRTPSSISRDSWRSVGYG